MLNGFAYSCLISRKNISKSLGNHIVDSLFHPVLQNLRKILFFFFFFISIYLIFDGKLNHKNRSHTLNPKTIGGKKKSCHHRRKKKENTARVYLNHITEDEIEKKKNKKNLYRNEHLQSNTLMMCDCLHGRGNSEVHKSPNNLSDRIVVATLNEWKKNIQKQMNRGQQQL